MKKKDQKTQGTLVDRHNKGKNKYMKYQQSKVKEKRMLEAVKGKKSEEMIPRPGEFIVVATDKKHDPQNQIAVPLETIMQRAAPIVGKTLQKIRSIPVVGLLKQASEEFVSEEFPEQSQQQPPFREETPTQMAQRLEKERYKSSMTTNLRNIMRRQQKELLTTTSHLLHTSVLKNVAEESKVQQQPDKKLVRPSSSYALLKRTVGGDTEGNIGINGARQRDIPSEKWNSYKIIPNQYTRMHSAKSIFQAIYKTKIEREIIIPEEPKAGVLQHQELLLLQKIPQSPFMKSKIVPKIPVDTNFDPIVKRADEHASIEPSNKIIPADEDFHTMPLEAYDPFIDTEKGDELLESFRGKDGRVKGRSRWFYPDGTSEFRDCEILSYDHKENRYIIKWSANGLIKKASRFNIRIENENLSILTYRIETAVKNRRIAEKIIQCLTFIDSIQTPPPTFPGKEKERISFYVRAIPEFNRPYRDVLDYLALTSQKRASRPRYKFTLGTLGTEGEIKAMKSAGINVKCVQGLFQEIEKDYKKAFKVMEFEAQLPYKEEFYDKFAEIIPFHKFKPVSEKIIEETSSKGVLNIGERSKPFFGLLKEMSKKLHQGDSKRLDTLVSVNTNFNKFSKEIFFEKKYDRPLELKNYIETNTIKCHTLMSDWKECMIQASDKIRDMLREVKAQIDAEIQMKLKAASHESAKRNVGESKIPDEVLQTMTRFQSLVNFIFERGIRQSFEQSVDKFIENFDDILGFLSDSLGTEKEELEKHPLTIQRIRKIADDAIFKHRMIRRPRLKCVLRYEPNEGIYLTPHISEWRDKIVHLIDYVINLIMNCPCLFTSELEYARESRVVLVVADPENDSFTVSRKEKLAKILETLLFVPTELERLSNQYKEVLDQVKATIKEKSKEAHVTNEEYDKELQKLKYAQEQLETLFPDDHMFLGIFDVNCKEVRERLKDYIANISERIYQSIKLRIAENTNDIDSAVKNIIAELEKEPPIIEDLVEQNRFIQAVESRRVDIQNIIIGVFSKIGLLEKYLHRLDAKELKKTFAAFTRTLDIVRLKRNSMVRNSTLWGEYKDKLRAETSVLLLEAGKLKEQLDLLQTKTEINECKYISYEYEELGENINKAIHRAEVILARERLFMLPNTSFDDLYNTKRLFTPYNELWRITRNYFEDYPIWTTGPIANHDRDKIMNDVNSAITTLKGYIANEFLSDPKAQQIADVMLKHFIDFKPMVPLIYDLRNPAMQKRHWEALKQVTGIEIPPDGQISLNDLLNRGIEKFKEQINDISDYATKEKALLQDIEKMRKEWSSMKFEMKPYLDTEIYVISSLVHVVDKLEDHLARTLVLASSPYTKYIENDLQNWKSYLNRALDLVDIWGKIQRNWQCLYPMFSSNELMLQLPKEAAEFEVINAMWTNVMMNTKQNPSVMEAIFQGRQYEAYEKANKQMEGILKGINDYLEKKRLQFPKFFFFSNEDLIFFLSREKEPLSLEPYLHKCFDGVSKLVLGEDGRMIKGIVSTSGGTIEFVNSIALYQEAEATNRPVEDWLKEIEQEISATLHKQYESLVTSTTAKPDSQQPQILQLMNQIEWTQMVEKNIKEKTLPKAAAHVADKINLLVQKVQDSCTSEGKRAELSSLILLNIHNKEVIESLNSLDISNVASYDWQAELRHYFGEESEKVGALCKVLTCTREYGFDYLSDCSRLVMTPLTMRCYRTLLNSIHTFCGGATEGATGIGKTETTKDLGKAIGKVCLVFSGSAVLKVDSFARLFKGVASSGMWVCIDEFNKIQLEVLSVVAQYVQAVLRSLKAEAPTVDLQESTTLLNAQCGIFITFSPYHASKTKIEIPENLKLLFRSIIMTVPDKAAIAQAYLESYGYKNPRALGKALANVFDLATNQLRNKDHYDFSLRSLKIVLKAALKEKKEDEKVTIRKCLEEFYGPRLDPADKNIFNHILADQLPDTSGADTEDNVSPDFDRAIKIAFKVYNLQVDPYALQKVQELKDITSIRPGVIILGSHYSGKSSMINVLSLAGSFVELLEKDPEVVEKIEFQLNNEENGQRLVTEELNTQFLKSVYKTIEEKVGGGKLVQLHKIAPTSFTLSNFYGEFDPKNNLWREGLLPHCVRTAISQAGTKASWIVFDGDLGKSWCDGLYSALDDTRRLCLPNSECLVLPRDLTFIFETDSLSHAAPSIVSRCGILTVSNRELSWQSIYESWLETLPPMYRTHSYTELLASLKKELLDPIFAQLWDVHNDYMGDCSQAWACQCFTKVFEAFLFEQNTREELDEKYREQQQKQARREAYMRLEGTEVPEESPRGKRALEILSVKRVLEISGLYLLGLVWGIGPLAKEETRAKVYRIMQGRFAKLRGNNEPALEYIKDAETVYPPEDVILNEVYFDLKTSMWVSFKDLLWAEDPNNDLTTINEKELVVPNEESCKHIWILKTLLQHNTNIMVLGSGDSGKSTILNRVMTNEISSERWLKKTTQFTGKTSASALQEMVESNFEKRVKNVYAPKGFAQRFLLCIDDINLPNASPKNSQNPLELLRALICHKGLYDYKQNKFKEMIKLQVSAASKTDKLSPRLLRYFCIVNIPPLSETALRAIFGKILEWGFKKYEGELNRYMGDLVTLTLNVYKTVAQTFLPVPAKCHYRFSLRSLIDIFKGLSAVPPAEYEKAKDELQKQTLLYKLWMHECTRTFGDALADVTNRKEFEEILKNVAEGGKHVADWSVVSTSPYSILFGNITTGTEYTEESVVECTAKLNDSLLEYAKSSKQELNLVLSETIIHQIAQIARLLSICKRHGLLIGVGGNGRTRLTKIVCFLLGYNIFTLGTHRRFGKAEWRENLKQLFRTLGSEKRDTVFLCSDQIFDGKEENDDSFVEDLNSLLLNEEVPHLHTAKEKEELRADRKHTSYEEYMNQARTRLKILICMNPVSNSLRK